MSKRTWSVFHSNTISSVPSQAELFQLSVLYLFVFVENKGSGSARLVGVWGVESGDLRVTKSR